MSRNPYPLKTCPEHLELLALAEGTLSETEATSITEHVATCRSCDVRLGAIEEQSDDLVRALAMLPATADDEATFQSLQAQLLATPEQFGIRVSGSTESEVTEAFDEILRQDIPTNVALPIELGNYELLEQIGAGANGAVFRARHRRLEKQVAVKLLLHAGGPAVEEFLNEMRVIGRLDHPNVIQATDAGEHDGIYFLVMEFVPGLDVSSLLRQHGPLATADACEIARQAALGLSVAHQHDLVHRDVKTSNLLFTSAGQVKLLDLGLATITSRTPGTTRNQSGPRGTADYMAPEQWREANTVTSKADIYSLGCTLFKLLTGTPPNRPLPDGLVSLEEAHLHGVIPELSGTRGSVPGSLDAYIRRMLSKDPADRPDSAYAVADVLSKYTPGAKLSQLAQSVMPDAVPVPDIAPPRATHSLVTTRRAALVSMLAGLGIVAWYANRRSPVSTATVDTGKWRPLEPIAPKLIFPKTQLNGKSERDCSLRTDAGAMYVESNAPVLLHLGRPLTGGFRYRVQLERNDWSLPSGLVFRLRAEPTLTYQFQTFEVYRSTTHWSLGWNAYPSDFQQPPIALAGVDVPLAEGDDKKELAIVLGVNGFPQFYFDGKRIPQSDWTISKEAREFTTTHSRQIASTYAGHIGVVHFPGTTIVRSPELMYI